MFLYFKDKKTQSNKFSLENRLIEDNSNLSSQPFLYYDCEESTHIPTPLEKQQHAEIQRLKQQIAQLESAYTMEIIVSNFCDCPGRNQLEDLSIYELSDLQNSAKNLLKNCRALAEPLQKISRASAEKVQDLESASKILPRVINTILLRSLQK